MKKFLLIMLIFAGACTSVKESTKPVVTVSILPQKYFIERIIGDFADIQVLIPPGASPATYELSPSQMRSLSKSKAWFRVGHIGFEEAWHAKIEQSNDDLLVFDTSTNAELIAGEEMVHGDHVHLHGIDPHIWMSPSEVKKMIKLSYDALIELFPEQESIFAIKYELLQQGIEELDKLLVSKFTDLENRKFIIFHPALTYLARDYSLEQISLELDGKEPSPRHLANLVEQAKAEDIHVVFIQKEFDQDNARQLAREIDGVVVQIDPLNADWSGQLVQIADKIVESTK